MTEEDAPVWECTACGAKNCVNDHPVHRLDCTVQEAQEED